MWARNLGTPYADFNITSSVHGIVCRLYRQLDRRRLHRLEVDVEVVVIFVICQALSDSAAAFTTAERYQNMHSVQQCCWVRLRSLHHRCGCFGPEWLASDIC